MTLKLKNIVQFNTSLLLCVIAAIIIVTWSFKQPFKTRE